MAQLRERDYRAILGFLDGLYGQTDIEAFSGWLLREAPNLVAGHHATWNEFAVTVPRARSLEHPRIPLRGLASKTAVFEGYLLEHPGIRRWLASGETGPFVLSDALGERALHRLGLYQHLYRRMDYEDQVALLLSPPRGEVAALALARDRRGFSERDREVMALIRPHLARVHANLRTLARARMRLEGMAGEDPALALLELGPGGEVRGGLDRAQRLLECYFPTKHRRAPDRLPATLARWLEHRPRAPLVIRRGERRLVVRFFAGAPEREEAARVLIEDHAAPEALSRLRAMGLTVRETRVLAELEKGLTNEDIAAALGISPATVKKHLENIYAKLGVGNRAAALSWLHRVTHG